MPTVRRGQLRNPARGAGRSYRKCPSNRRNHIVEQTPVGLFETYYLSLTTIPIQCPRTPEHRSVPAAARTRAPRAPQLS